MKFVIYNGQQKYTVDNVSIPDMQKVLPSLLEGTDEEEMDIDVSNFDLYNFNITSTRAAMFEEEGLIQNEELQREIDEGINWRQETIN